MVLGPSDRLFYILSANEVGAIPLGPGRDLRPVGIL
jgi:hypothetical protein